MPKLVERYMAGGTKLDDYITHELPFDQVPLVTDACTPQRSHFESYL